MHQIIRQIVRTGIKTEAPPQPDDALRKEVREINGHILKQLGRALAIRHVDAGSCNGCELEIHCLNNPCYNIEGLGIHFVASPRHADMLLVTGPVSRHMETALRRTYDAAPEPKLVVAIGDCGNDGGIFAPLDADGEKCESYAIRAGVSSIIPVDVVVPGCPPTPVSILQGILTAVSQQNTKP